jgi:lysophospholipase L1-like esterase
MRRRSSRLIGNLITLAVTLVIFFGVIEVALRVTGIDKGLPKTPPIYQKSGDPELSYELKPNLHEQAFRSTVVTDRRGFRSPEVVVGKPTIALLGDSISFGYGLENDQTIASRMSAALGEGFNVVTAASPGYNLGQEAAFYKAKVALLHPSVLILQFHWNDLTSNPPDVLDDEGNLHAHTWTPQTPKCNPIMTGILSWIPGSCWLDLHSALYRTIRKVVSSRTEQQNAAQQVNDLTQSAFSDYVTNDQLAAYQKTLTDFAATLPKDMQKVFVIWPERPLHMTSAPALKAMAEKLGFHAINLYEVFGNRGESLSWDTVHPSAKMADEAAGVVTGALKEWKLLPQ